MSAYSLLISSATAIGPLLASFITEYSPGSWRDYIWVCAALAGANSLAIFLFYPESNFNRTRKTPHVVSVEGQQVADANTEKGEIIRTDTISWHHVSVVKKSWTKIWTSFITVNPDVNILRVFFEPTLTLGRPAVLYAVFVFGTSLAAQVIMM
ncbi:uncharacterized protein N0V89_011300 [Didymosphaeria variabile]|uniref:MFS general substrate transporter n=1 Tax=Didymosphaeria variabile TaxID=1932322 RepID=A0A9W9C702_9PLEO|nr:uncharacterized protein N0V89_011300 [Didymosphaeria variabile]KAJ4347359.1 hypothetical protein N0V89_011300 [Didymosphaeria variabile]